MFPCLNPIRKCTNVQNHLTIECPNQVFPSAPRPTTEIRVSRELSSDTVPALPFNSYDAFDAEEGVLADIAAGRVALVIDRRTFEPLMDNHDTGYGIGYGEGDMFLVGDEFSHYYTFAENEYAAWENYVQCVGEMVDESELESLIEDYGGEEAFQESNDFQQLDSYHGDGTGIVSVSDNMWMLLATGVIEDTQPARHTLR